MGWDSRRYMEGGARGRRRGGGGSVLRRIFGDGENPFDWALPLYTAWGIRVRIHLAFVVMIIFELLAAMPKDGIGWSYRAIAMGTLFTLVLLHEYGHCIACRWVGGTADQILLWPLGGLAYCAPPHHWKADLITTLGGPMVNVVLVPALGAALLVLGQSTETLIFNPFDPGFVLTRLRLGDGTCPLWLVALWWAYYINLLLLAFNTLVAMYPMDSARIVNALMWSRMGHRRAMGVTIKIGFGVAMVLCVFGMVQQQVMLVVLAVFGFASCWNEKKKLEMAVSDPSVAGYDFERGYAGFPEDEADPLSERNIRARERQRKQDQDDQTELDRILAKIASSGMASLSRAEKRWLERATERRRRG